MFYQTFLIVIAPLGCRLFPIILFLMKMSHITTKEIEQFKYCIQFIGLIPHFEYISLHQILH
jgi:hypothetical protein